jgi:hypothetical protein
LIELEAIERIGGVGPDGWLFTGPTGEPPQQNTIGYWWRKTRLMKVLPQNLAD